MNAKKSPINIWEKSGLRVGDTPLKNDSNDPSVEFINLVGSNLNGCFAINIYNNAKNIDVSKNQISQIDYLDELKILEILKASNNKISKIPNINQTNLKTVDFSSNKISILEKCSQSKSLKKVDFSFNQISKINEHCVQNEVV